MAASAAPRSHAGRLDVRRARPLLSEAIARWRAAGADTSGLSDVAIRVADLPGRVLARAEGRTITLDGDAAGWGWYAGASPRPDAGLVRSGRGPAARRIDLPSVLAHELGHLLGRGHAEQGVMALTLGPGVRQRPAAVVPDAGPGPAGTVPRSGIPTMTHLVFGRRGNPRATRPRFSHGVRAGV